MDLQRLVRDAPCGFAGVELGDYAGVYSGQPWDSDYMLIPWAGGLTWLDPDSGEPARRMWRLKPLG